MAKRSLENREPGRDPGRADARGPEMSLEAILEEYRQTTEEEPRPEPEARSIPMEAEEDGVLTGVVPPSRRRARYKAPEEDQRPEELPEEDQRPEELPEEDEPVRDYSEEEYPGDEPPEGYQEYQEEAVPEEDLPEGEDEPPEEEDPERIEGYEEDDADFYAGALPDEGERAEAERREKRRAFRRAALKGNLFQRLSGWFVTVLAAASLKRRQQQEQKEPDPENVQAEMPPRRAARHYAAQMPSLKLRTAAAFAVCLLPVWITLACGYGWALPGRLQTDMRLASLVCVVALLTVMLLALDIVTAGIMSAARGRPGAESLIVLSCLAALGDGAATAVTGGGGRGVAACAVPALALAFALWSAWFTCRGYRHSFLAAYHAKDAYAVTSEVIPGRKGRYLIKSRRTVAGFIRRAEEPSAGESLCAAAAPFLAGGALVLSLGVSLGSGDPGAFFRIFALTAGLSVSFPWLFSYAWLFARTARHLMMNGSAIAGWSGVRDIGMSRRLILTDTDVFPDGSLEITSIRIPEKVDSDKVISFAGSMLSTAGSGMAGPFLELMRRNDCQMQKVEEFTPGEGGVKAYIQCVEVRVGSAGYMHLSGVKLPSRQKTENALYVAVSGKLVGVFLFNYRATAPVQKALYAMRRSRRRPIFAMRDFNVDPLLIARKFGVSSDGFEFPTMLERYRISGIPADRDSPTAALMGRDGLDMLADVAECGTRLFIFGRLCAWGSLAAAGAGMLVTAVPCWLGLWDSASAANVLVYMLACLAPVGVMAAALQK